MGLIREPLGVNYVVESRKLTKKEREMISKHILAYNTRRVGAKKKLRTLSNRRKKTTLKTRVVLPTKKD